MVLISLQNSGFAQCYILMVISGVLAGYTIKYQRRYSMLEEKLTFCMKINEEIITVTCLLILGIYGLHDEFDFLGETGVKVLDYSFLGAFIYGFLIEILHVLYHQLVSLYGLCVKIKKSCSKNKVGQESNA